MERQKPAVSARKLRLLFFRFEESRRATEDALEEFSYELDLLRRFGYRNRELKKMIEQIALYLSLDPWD